MNELHDNITFFLNEKNNNDDSNNEDEIQKMMDEFTNLNEQDTQRDNPYLKQWLYEDDNPNYLNDEIIYEKEYTIKDLLKICSYYGIDKDVKTSKCKKQDIISTIVYFESLAENVHIVQKRYTMWKYIDELLNDPKMKKFVIWN
jgi:hypothetical protein